MIWVFLALLAIGLTFIAYAVNSAYDWGRLPFGESSKDDSDANASREDEVLAESVVDKTTERNEEWPVHGTFLNPQEYELRQDSPRDDFHVG